MRLLISILLLSSSATYANDQEIWASIRELSTHLGQLEAKINQLPKPLPAHQVGESLRGGVVFYVDETGRHGLIVSKVDAGSIGLQWRNGLAGNKITNAHADGLHAGEINTRLIIAEQTIDNQKGLFAALQAANFQVLGDGFTACTTPHSLQSLCYSGWYLASAFELQLLYASLPNLHLNLAEPALYWSSTEASVNKAWLMDLTTGGLTAASKANAQGHVRPISRF
jgi:hypothetical protein